MKIPSNYQDVKRLADLFEAYYEDHYFYVILVFVSTYLVKQAFIIPGSAIMVSETKKTILLIEGKMS